jgi:hypothetical protein
LKKGESKARGAEGDLSNKISPNPSFSKRGTEYLHKKQVEMKRFVSICFLHEASGKDACLWI